MPQIIKHRRGPVSTLKNITPYSGEVVFTTSSLGDVVGPNLHIGDGTQQGGFLVNRLQYGATPPSLAGVNTVMNDLPFYDTDDKILYRLNSGGHANLDLTGNIKDRTIGGTLNITGDLSASSDIWVGGDLHAVGSVTFDGGSSGTITMGSGADDNIVFTADVNSNIIPNTDNTFDLGSSGQQWKDIYLNGIGYIDQLGTDADPSTVYIGGGEIDGTVIGGESPAAATVTTLNATGATTLDGAVTLGNATGDDITVTGYVASNVLPKTDDTFNLGSSGKQWKDIHIDGVGYIDSVSADTMAVSDLTNNRVVIAGASGELEDDANFTFDGTTLTLGAVLDVNGNVDIDNTTTTIDSSGAISLQGGAASDFSTGGGAITIDGNAGVDIKEAGSSVITIDTARDVLFSQTGGSTSDPDVQVNGYAKFAGITEFDAAVDMDSTLDVQGLADFQNSVHVQTDLQVTGSAFIKGNLEVLGTTTTVDSTTVQIGDNIIELNTAAAASDGGIYVYDTTNSEQTGSILWDRTNNHWKGGIKDSEYRLPEQAAAGNLTENKPVIVDANGRLESSANITDDGTDIDFNNKDLTSVNRLEGVDANTYVDLGASTLVVTKGTIQPSAHNGDDLGATGTRYKNLWLQGNADLEGDIDVNGTANLDVIDVDGTFDFATTGTFNANTTYAATSDITLAFENGTNAPQMMWRNPSDKVRFVATPPTENLNGDAEAHSSGSLLLYDGVDGFYHTRIIDGGQF